MIILKWLIQKKLKSNNNNSKNSGKFLSKILILENQIKEKNKIIDEYENQKNEIKMTFQDKRENREYT